MTKATPEQLGALAAIDAVSVALREAHRVLSKSFADAGPVDPPPVVTPSLLHQAAVSLAPGEWRRVPTQLPPGVANMKAFQTASTAGGGSADGMGWTDRLIEHKGMLMWPLMRDTFGKALALMAPDGKLSRIESPAGWNPLKTERRPFNRWFVEGDFACFAPSDAKPAMGYVLRTPLDNPGVFERDGIAIGDSQMDSVGNFAMCSAWGRRFAYTPGGKVRSWAAGETSWREHAAHIPKAERGSGYAGTVIYNAIRDEVIAIGGQYFGANPDISDRGVRVSSPDAQGERFLATFEDGSPLLRVTAAATRIIVHPTTGEYLLIDRDGVMYRSADANVWRLYEDLRTLRPWGRYEAYFPWCHLSQTPDVIVAVSHIEGVWLHRCKE